MTTFILSRKKKFVDFVLNGKKYFLTGEVIQAGLGGRAGLIGVGGGAAGSVGGEGAGLEGGVGEKLNLTLFLAPTDDPLIGVEVTMETMPPRTP